MRYTLLLVGILHLYACVQKHQVSIASAPHCTAYDSLIPKYSKGFKAFYYDGFTVVQLLHNSQLLEQYVLLPGYKKMPIGFESSVRIASPVSTIAVNSSTFIAMFEACGALQKVKGVSDLNFICNATVHERVKQGLVTALGNEGSLNYEQLLTLKPDFIMQSGYEVAGSASEAKLKQLKIPRVLNFDFAESHPLARAEWLKYSAVFVEQEALADSIFNAVERDYLQLKDKVQLQIHHTPSVFFNLPWKEVWYMPSGETYMANLVSDAGADFVWKGDGKNNSLNLSLSFEEVLSHAQDADYWLHPNSVTTRDEMLKLDSKFALFDAYKYDRVYNNNLQHTVAGGNNFWERGTVYPNEILADVIAIFHPELMPGHSFHYYRQLR